MFQCSEGLFETFYVDSSSRKIKIFEFPAVLSEKNAILWVLRKYMGVRKVTKEISSFSFFQFMEIVLKLKIGRVPQKKILEILL